MCSSDLLQMETQHIPSVQGTDAKGNVYARVTPVQFPCDREGRSALVHRVTSYNRSAVWESVKEWFAGGASFDGAIDPSNAMVHEFKEGGYATWQIYPDGTKNKEDKMKVDWGKLATPAIHESNTVGYRWDPTWVRQKENEGKTLAVLPEFYRLVKGEGDKSQWVPVREEEVPEETGLRKVVFEKVRNSKPKTYSTPDQADSSWKAPGPKAGPFTVDVGDGSRLTYYWYRFADQPALLNADMSDEERERMQRRVEKLHASWKKEREYLPPPTVGELAQLDPALIVTPPPGLEIGYVPIVTRQEPRDK